LALSASGCLAADAVETLATCSVEGHNDLVMDR
jgi:hypothetical protein